MYRWIDPNEKVEELSFFHAYLKLGDTVVDVGANIGETVLTSSVLVGPSGCVYAFEPHPKIFGFLQDNLRLNKVRNVRAFNLGLGDAPTTVAFSDDRRDDMNRVMVDQGGITIALETLDRILADCGHIQLLKVDVEGYEIFVFEGGRQALSHIACIYFEVSATHFERFGYTTANLLNLIVAAGFRIFRIERPGVLFSVPSNFTPSHFENCVALRDPADFTRRSGWTVSADV